MPRISRKPVTAALGAAALLALAAPLVAQAPAQDKVQLVRKAKAGDASRYNTLGTIALEANGQQMTMELKQTDTITVKDVAANGDLTLESRIDSQEITFNGQQVPAQNVGATTTIVTRPNGSMVTYTSAPGGDPDLDRRMFNATNPLFPDTPIGVGDTWQREIKTTDGTTVATLTCEVLALEKVDAVDTVKMKMVFTEAGDASALKTTGTYWIERATGDQVKGDVVMENVPLGPTGTVASVTVKQSRMAGGVR